MRTSTRARLAKAAKAAAAAAILAAAVGWSGAASAAPPGHDVVGSTSASTSVAKTHPQACPAGTVVTGGAGYLTATPAMNGRVALTRLEPHDNGSGFTASMREIVPSATNWPLTTRAACMSQPRGWDVVPQTGDLSQANVRAECTGGRVAIGMGGRVNGGGDQVVLDHVKPIDDDTIEARAVPIAGTNPPPWSVTAFAVCAEEPAGYEVVDFDSPPAAGDSHVSVVRSCPAGKVLLSAGADIEVGNGAVALTNVNISPDSTARARADEIVGEAAGNWRLAVYGICAS